MTEHVVEVFEYEHNIKAHQVDSERTESDYRYEQCKNELVWNSCHYNGYKARSRAVGVV